MGARGGSGEQARAGHGGWSGVRRGGLDQWGGAAYQLGAGSTLAWTIPVVKYPCVHGI